MRLPAAIQHSELHKLDVRVDRFMMSRKQQFTLAILKPSLCAFPERVEAVYKMIQSVGMLLNDFFVNRVGLKPILKKRIENWDRREVSRFYKSHQGKFFYTRLVFTMMNGPGEVLGTTLFIFI